MQLLTKDLCNAVGDYPLTSSSDYTMMVIQHQLVKLSSLDVVKPRVARPYRRVAGNVCILETIRVVN